MNTWRPLGKNRYLIDNDCVVWEVRSEATVADIHQITDIIVGVYQKLGVVYVICDAFGAPQPSAAVRTAMNDRYKAGTAVPAPTIVVGGTPLMRTVIALVFRAIRLLGGKPPPIEFVATMEEAQAWLARERHKRESTHDSAPT